MLDFIKRLFTTQKCAVCNNKPVDPTYYYNDNGEKVPVCFTCVTYAERRAFRKV
ncbi:hypothetical protein J416_11917 [Gracilibacillus halophilus YIM-C55.5]|uniref:Uncharacterized protein n=1 Tax=Gracilibacillus halophilus YIM-C55.5 TaxID=1308866 RepID=N4WAA8_9BACI|nr:hypothetical protein [Gracilibacillus halophilus]ENH96209.1 hypothetical protein J416_11917 [Gracilibacillus halophilus YIM-C55.5]